MITESNSNRVLVYEYKGHLIINHRFFDPLIKDFNKRGIREKKNTVKNIISFTSFPQRMPILPYTLYSLFTQTIKPDEIILWLAEEQFPNRLNDIPNDVLKFQDLGLKIKFTEDIKSYKKLIPSLSLSAMIIL